MPQEISGMMPGEYLAMPVELRVALRKYLGRQPYDDVAHLLEHLHVLQPFSAVAVPAEAPGHLHAVPSEDETDQNPETAA